MFGFPEVGMKFDGKFNFGHTLEIYSITQRVPASGRNQNVA
jgi:hypothetical protein